jgi:type IV pilus assembly protein PilN
MMHQPNNALVLNEAGTLNQLFEEKAFSWTLAMEDLETVLPSGVQVTTLEPIRDKDGNITLRFRVVGPRDKSLELVQNLEHSKYFIRPTIIGESIENAGGPGQALEPVSPTNKVNFELLAEYNVAAVAEKPPVPKKPEDAHISTAAFHPAPAAPARPAAGPHAPHSAVGMGPAGPASTIPATPGPGLRRPPFTGVSQPPAAVGRSSAPHGFPPVTQPQPAPKPRPGGPQ